MKRISILLVALLAMILAACSPAAAANPAAGAVAPAPADGEILSTAYADAASTRNQLAYGTLKLEGTDQAVTPVQAQALLPLWQAVVALSGASTTTPEELTAVQDQISSAMQAGQVQAIAKMQITNAALSDFYASKGIVLPTPVPGVTKVPGANKNLSEEARQATRTAKEASGAATGSGQAARTLLFDEVVKLLAERAAQ